MIRLILLLLLLGLSLLTIFRAPTNGLWYLSIAVTEFPWIFIGITTLLLYWRFEIGSYHLLATIVGVLAIVLYTLPIIGAYRIAKGLDKAINTAFAKSALPPSTTKSPFTIAQMITGIGVKGVAYKTLTYRNDLTQSLTLDFYSGQKDGNRPCIVVVHGGSWAAGNSLQLPELNTYLAKKGYHVAAINYRLAPAATFPAPIQDVEAALAFLHTNAASLHIDTTNFILLGRSAGAQVVLTAAYSQKLPGLKGVIAFYGPADMIWGYGNPAKRLVMDSKKVMEAYLGGTYKELPLVYTSSSPMEKASPQSPPTLLIHGKNDPLVAYEHSTRLSGLLTHYHVPHFLLSLPWATHACDYTLNGPSGQLSTYTVERFIQIVTA